MPRLAAFGMVLRDSPHRGNASFESATALARAGLDRIAAGAGFLELIDAAQKIGKPVAGQAR